MDWKSKQTEGNTEAQTRGVKTEANVKKRLIRKEKARIQALKYVATNYTQTSLFQQETQICINKKGKSNRWEVMMRRGSRKVRGKGWAIPDICAAGSATGKSCAVRRRAEGQEETHRNSGHIWRNWKKNKKNSQRGRITFTFSSIRYRFLLWRCKCDISLWGRNSHSKQVQDELTTLWFAGHANLTYFDYGGG